MAGHFNYETNTWYDLRDTRGPSRTIVAVDDSGSGATMVTNSCGHVEPCANHFHYVVGDSTHCFDCIYSADNVISKEVRQ
jgi:hypothetical protein